MNNLKLQFLTPISCKAKNLNGNSTPNKNNKDATNNFFE